MLHKLVSPSFLKDHFVHEGRHTGGMACHALIQDTMYQPVPRSTTDAVLTAASQLALIYNFTKLPKQRIVCVDIYSDNKIQTLHLTSANVKC